MLSNVSYALLGPGLTRNKQYADMSIAAKTAPSSPRHGYQSVLWMLTGTGSNKYLSSLNNPRTTEIALWEATTKVE